MQDWSGTVPHRAAVDICVCRKFEPFLSVQAGRLRVAFAQLFWHHRASGMAWDAVPEQLWFIKL